MKIMKQKNNLKSGFSLVEMLVAIGVFMSVMTIAITSLISIINANKKAQSIKNTIDSVTFAVEDISRDMRTGTDYQCSQDGNFSGGKKDCPTGGVAVRYINHSDPSKDVGVEYKYDSSTHELIRNKFDAGFSNRTTHDFLISSDSNAKVSNMEFYVIGADDELNSVVAERTQPRVIVTVSGLISTAGSSDVSSFNLQTSVSQRAIKH